MKKNLVKLTLAFAVLVTAAVVGFHFRPADPNDPANWQSQTETKFYTSPAPAEAQVPAAYDKFGTRVFNLQTIPTTVPTLWCTVWSDTNGTIQDGRIVVIDTTTTSPTRIVVKAIPVASIALSSGKILGLAYGDIPASGTSRPGKVLIMGFHGNATMAATGLSANLAIKRSPTVPGALTTVQDSLSGAVGWFIGYNAGSTAANSRGKVYILRPMGFVNTTL